jgi:uncharacterized DUF497 family protein
MNKIEFAWDPEKEGINRKKHGISFDEAKTVFYDENALLFYDEDHSDEEERFIMLGLSSTIRVLVVCHCYISKNKIIRIFSARKATAKESKHYTGGTV